MATVETLILDKEDCSAVFDGYTQDKLVETVLDLQKTYYELSHRINDLRTENGKLGDENKTINDYIDNLLSKVNGNTIRIKRDKAALLNQRPVEKKRASNEEPPVVVHAIKLQATHDQKAKNRFSFSLPTNAAVLAATAQLPPLPADSPKKKY